MEKSFDVIRAHGDFAVGDVRTGRQEDLQHLIGKCLVLRADDAGAAAGDDAGAAGGAGKAAKKAAPPVKNKAAPDDTQNKGA